MADPDFMDHDKQLAVVLRDHQNYLPLGKLLSEEDIVTLLTPVVVPPTPGASSGDPFEPLGRALAVRHPKIRHVPYTKRDGITGTHTAFINRSRVVIFVISGPPAPGEQSQAEFAEIARMLAEQKPQIIVACFNVENFPLPEALFPAIVQIFGFTAPDLEAAAEAIFGAATPSLSPSTIREPTPAPREWTPTEWNWADVEPVHDLWCRCLPLQFHLDSFNLGLALRISGYAKHYVVKDPVRQTIVGFCATYTTFADDSEFKLIGSLAMLLVEKSFRGLGIGRSLHDHACRQLKRTKGVIRLQLGSTFPRLLYGVPTGMASASWFQRREWQMDHNHPGRGQEVCDWVLNFSDLPPIVDQSADLQFRPAGLYEYEKVLRIVARESARKEGMGWYDQYARLSGSMDVEDVMIGLEGDTIVAVALTYVQHSGSLAEGDRPLVRTIGDGVGGVTCICITDDNPNMRNTGDTIMVRLLDACIRSLAEKGMKRLFLDGVRGGHEGFQSLGFQQWASYKDVWRRV